MNLRLIAGKGRHLPLLFTLQILILGASAQGRYTGASGDLVVNGTSTLHDWTMKSVKADCSATFTVNASGQVDGLSALNFSTPAKALKSEHTSMDNNAYKALKTDKNPVITYTMTSVRVTPGNSGSTVALKGKLTIAGATKDEDLVATCKINPDNTITVTGTKAISMQEFQIEAPTFMLGTIKTGNSIVLSFHLTLKKV
ncbi:MAG: YceI family protein [Bacteroidota bacterium]|nr:YceI family protein [Bacteroidota bacterium]MDP4215574.1 YceI family protein [Bacteroidota bacterium]MDP4245992.1 YceI family protein [Bacteroidota bacterium]MDP4253829.1 YceI family protein [Bacteroidota bacterium]MDP4257765.1 YceI family protein [Bacteroidota bacterium]